MSDYQTIIESLRASYNREMAKDRDQMEKDGWKVEERQTFLNLLKWEGKTSLLEVGAGTGTDSLFFQNNGLNVISTDLSADMVDLCRAKGLEAHVMDFLSLDFPPESFDTLYALNCLLHVPTRDLPTVLGKLRELLRPDGLFFLGVYGGAEEEGPIEDDWHQPPRFFAFHSDEFLQQAVAPYFDIVSFKAIPLEERSWHFQSMILRRKER
ncbi:class I SAM-dependent methyltransferase [Ktedonospora formicarum]|uniref:Methyltransferase domain-containing protein n=1 Tax=Ktedonospora formicarum TaxID=2778364 RepID=A0A8J3MVF6_9CHLR|nr:class I SAM-dependent methyltransferase [Ktedonospora formicarum]GHO47891.1 hypothetical protein KSX_60540 [Ktedonospora formicarum]